MESVHLSMAEVAVAKEEITQSRKAITGEIFVGKSAIPIVDRVANSIRLIRIFVHRVRPKRGVTRCDQVKVFASDQPVHGGSQIGEPDGVSPSDFALERGVVLMDRRLVNIKRHYVHRRCATETRGYSTA